ncbi:MAG: hypothetical protein H6R26_2231, partial [Proteobacteria bacterium]|nr:hypothetical protein [Pseudomonadota bacterium]
MLKRQKLISLDLIPMLLYAELAFLLFSGAVANAAITANGTFTSAQTTGATSLTWSHTVAAGTNRALFVELAIDGLGAAVTSVTYGGVALTQVGRGTGNHAIEIWRLISPAVGTANVVANFGGTTPAAGGATTFNGVLQSTPTGTFVSATGTGTTASVTVTSAAGDLVIDAQYWRNTSANMVGAGQTLQWSASNATMLGGSTSEAGATSVTMTGTCGASSQWEIGAVSIRASPVSTTTLGNGTDPANANLAPGGSATMADAFTFQTASGTDAITAVTVTLAAGTSGGLSLVAITN